MYSAVLQLVGIVRIDLAYSETYEAITTDEPFYRITQREFIQQRAGVNGIEMKDGKRVTFSVRGYDVVGAYAEDNVTVWIDTSPPIIENLWLTRGDIVNISVHNATELADMTIEWNAFDAHSGLYEISWRLFDNFSNAEVLHGHSYESPQHESNTLTECEQEYSNYARGHNCYCSPYHGCFHQHFQVIPRVIDIKTAGGSTQHIGGIDAEKSEGVHEREYYIEVTAVNNAGLTTVRSHKISIDVSPPNAGYVHDGTLGLPELDFQQSLTLTAHWDDFLDKESGIKFYMYSFATRCLSADEMHYDKIHPEIVKTYETTASTVVQSQGQYYTTVVAYNHALDPSVPVCSDGVVIDSTPILISEVVINGGIVTPRIIRDIVTDEVFVLKTQRVIQAIQNPTRVCRRQKAFDVSTSDIQLIPRLRNSSVDSNVCESINSVSRDIVTFIRSDSHLEISWNFTEGPSGVYSFDIGLSSDNTHTPDIMSFQSSMHHSFMRLVHPGIWDGQEFFILLKVTSKAGVVDTTAVGPVMVVMSKPEFVGSIHINIEGNFLVASWGSDDFVDHGESGDLKFEFALGSSRFTSNVLPFSAQRSGGSCNINDTTSCTAVDMRNLKWVLHESTDYYGTVKATDLLGLFVVASSEKYTNNYNVPSSGVVYDIDTADDRPFVDIDDIDFQSKTDVLASRWNGFYHPHSSVQFRICIHDQNGINIVCETATSDDHHTFNGIRLQSYEKYYQEVTAISIAGNVSASSDGVIVVIPEEEHIFEIFDGLRCNNTGTKEFYIVSHYKQVDIFNCTEDIDYQYQTSSLNAYWRLPEDKMHFMQTIFWRVEKRAPVVDMWTPLSEYQTLRNRDVLHITGLYLIPGRKYRISVKACAQQFCFKSMSSDGVFIIPNPPITGSLSVNYDMGVNKDSDIEDMNEALTVIQRYEYAFTDGKPDSELLNKWDIIGFTSGSETAIQFEIIPLQKIRFMKCWKLAIRGFTKAGTYSIISSEIRNCSNLQEVKPSSVIDAVGKTIGKQDGHAIGGEIFLEQNLDWNEYDEDYTSYTNVISAVWPKLRYKHYNWAVISISNEDPTIFYGTNDNVGLRYPCTHPETIACGETDGEYMNAKFDTGVLKHGRRYIVCIHANETYLYHEKWTQHLNEFMECTDGVTVDITPPIAGKISTSDILVMWDSFSDIEEHRYHVHESGISYYAICIGSSPGGNDVINFVNVGLVNHKVFHNLYLQNGLSYYATVKGYDHVGLSTSEVSHSVVVDFTPPKVTGKSIVIPSRHILNATWKNVFEDTESGINRYEWSVGTSHGYENILEYTRANGDCAESELHPSRTIKDGHSYFVTVKAYNNAGLFSIDTSWAFVVDTTPPDSGLVYDGPNDGTNTDIDYMTSTNTVHAYWTHFIDAHTPVLEYFVSVGTCKECDDVLTEQSVWIKNEIEIDGLALMEGRVYYTSVKACNTAMLCSRASSDGFLIDKSPPTRGTVIDGLSGSDHEYQASRTHVGCKWFGFSDPQSGLSHYVWRLGTLKGGDDIVSATNVHNHEIAYIVDVQSHSGALLPVGRLIYCTVRAYNKAGFFSEVSSNGFVVDTSPPTIVKELALSPFGRSNSYDRTTLLRSSLTVYWDTSDSDSGISAQYLSVSSHMGGDFNLSTVKIDAVATDYTLLELDLHDGSYYDIKLTVCNGAKLCTQSLYENLLVDSTPPTMGTFAINTDHASELGRQPSNWMKWNPIILHISWLGFEDIHSVVKLKPVSDIACALLYQPDVITLVILVYLAMYEWSVGESKYDTPKGVFHEITDRVWHDAGSHMSWVYTLPRGHILRRNFKYSFFIRAWYGDNIYAIFKSSGVIILTKPPQTTTIRGVSVKEVLSNSLKDVDYISDTSHVMVDWAGKFLGDSIKKFHLYLSTQPNGKDVHVISTNINASMTIYDITGAKYKENTRYFSVVQAFNHAGLHTTLSSDGFMLDTEKPEGGTVNDGKVLHDVQFLNSSNQLPSFWYGFSDAISGIDHYEHCVSSLKYKGRCDIQPFINVGLWTYVERKSHEEFIQGELLFSEVRAYDMAGHMSDLMASDGILIDRTPPLRVTYVLSDENLVRNGSFEYAANSSLQCEDLPNSFWNGHNSCLKAIKAHNLPHGNSYLLLQGSVSQEIIVEHSGKFKLQFYTSNMPTELAQMSVQDGYVVVNETKHVFLMHKKPSLTEAVIWQEHHYLLNLPVGKTTVTFGAENKASFGIDDISIRYYSGKAYLENSTDVKHLQALTIHAHDWSSIYSDWHFEDPESGIVEYFWAIGTVRGGTQLQEYTSVGRNEFASSNTIQLQHNTVVFVSVMAVNGAGLRTVSYSEQIYIDLTPPEFEYVYDGDSSDFDIQFQTSLNISMAWSVKDPESGIQECSWAIGGSVVTSWDSNTLKAKADWSNVFNSTHPLYYEVTLRQENGKGDLIQWQETTNTEIEVTLEKDDISSSGRAYLNCKLSI
ncbi:hypothetical protein MAR_020262 [Mya arenaria]|uniref:Uncharacterized protein n=1 Tax=Mya arenaria TaxID=6604 RepID=A0ABY7E4F4_MYAAR|nr:hypothetical protein MAR_020262 [Mya arenaria]